MKFGALVGALAGLIMALASGNATAQDGGGGGGSIVSKATCHDSGAITKGKFASDMCWSCLFPMRLMGVGGGTRSIPSDRAAPICVCPGKMFGIPTPGATFGMWKPTHFVETVRGPGCLPALGQTASIGKILGTGRGNRVKEEGRAGFLHTHTYMFPTGAILDGVSSAACDTSSSSFDMDILSLSELDPTYIIPELSMVMNPESFLFNNPIAIAACMVDAVAATAVKPVNALFWCFGSWGQVYPLSGYDNSRSDVTDASLQGARQVAIQHKRMLMNKTYGNSAVCGSHMFPIYPKQQYRWQILYPMPQRFKNDWTGSATLLSREWRHLPVIGEDWVQVLFSYEECCVNF